MIDTCRDMSPADAPPKPQRRATAESMASKQREISVSEFFTKNRHLLGFDSPARALLTTVKEAVDNSLDAAEEAGILPTLRVDLVEVSEDRYRVSVEDNGPGIVKAQVPKVFGKLLYGSKFHRLAQRRGQQGLGVSAAGMYGQLTTGKPIIITSKTGKGRPAHHFEIVIDTARNAPSIVSDATIDWDRDHGTRVEIELEGLYKGGRRSVDEYLEQVAIANPHAEILYQPPRDRELVRYARLTEELPPEPVEIEPHPYGVELGSLQRLLKETQARTLSSALQTEFSRVSARVAGEILSIAGLPANRRPHEVEPAEVERLHRAIPKVKIQAPPSSCVVPIGEGLIRRGLEREIRAEFATSSTRPPAVYRGNPFIVEAGLAYGGDLRQETEDDEAPHASTKTVDAQQGPITLLRLANRVPLQYQQSACAIFRAAVETNWRQYGLTQPKGSLPQGPMVLLVHVASVWVPFTSESKEAVAHYPEMLKEIRLALQDCGRKLGGYLRRREHERRELRRRSIFEMYIGELVESLGKLTRVDRKKLQKELAALAAQHTGDGAEEAAPIIAATKRVREVVDEEADSEEMEVPK
jgi:DNA topoisomerase VI subunit B